MVYFIKYIWVNPSGNAGLLTTGVAVPTPTETGATAPHHITSAQHRCFICAGAGNELSQHQSTFKKWQPHAGSSPTLGATRPYIAYTGGSGVQGWKHRANSHSKYVLTGIWKESSPILCRRCVSGTAVIYLGCRNVNTLIWHRGRCLPDILCTADICECALTKV